MVCNITIAYWEINTGRRDGECPGCLVNLTLFKSYQRSKVKVSGSYITLNHTPADHHLSHSVSRIQHIHKS